MAGWRRTDPCLAALILFSFLVFGVLQVLNVLAADPANSYGLFKRGIANVSALYPLEITPAGATFAIWGVIYIWLLALLFYGLTSICRQTPEGPVYANPVLLPRSFYLAFIANNICNVTWLFLWDRIYIIASSVFLFLIFITACASLIVSYSALSKNRDYLIKAGRKGEIRAIIIIVQNGMATYATWTGIASLINLATAVAYTTNPPIGNHIASSISLALLTAEFVAFVATDLSVFNKYTQYVITPYLVLIVGTVGIIVKNWDPFNTNSIFTATILALSILGLIVKIARAVTGGSNLREKYQNTLQHNYKTLY